VVTVGVRQKKPKNNGEADHIVRNGDTPWSLAGNDYKSKTTHYFYPNGAIKNGQQVSDWAGIPNQTKIFVGYQGPYRVTASRPPIVIAGKNYRDQHTIYLFPDRRVLSGAQIKNFRRLPRGVRILLPLKKS
jgi:N-acetylmuramoyl-L-alanine amidase